jgi:hypothetical protein
VETSGYRDSYQCSTGLALSGEGKRREDPWLADGPQHSIYHRPLLPVIFFWDVETRNDSQNSIAYKFPGVHVSKILSSSQTFTMLPPCSIIVMVYFFQRQVQR